MIEYKALRAQAFRHYNDIAREVSQGIRQPGFFNSGFVGIDCDVDGYNQQLKKYCLPYVHLIEHYGIQTTNKTLLEVGCGFGRGCFFLKNKYNLTSVTGCDINPNVIDIAKQLFTKTEFIVADAVNLQTVERQFDIVITIETAPYWVNYPDVHKSFESVIKPGGSLLIASDIYRKNQIKLPNFRLIGQTDITDNVIKSMTEDEESAKHFSKRIQLFKTHHYYISQHYIRE